MLCYVTLRYLTLRYVTLCLQLIYCKHNWAVSYFFNRDELREITHDAPITSIEIYQQEYCRKSEKKFYQSRLKTHTIFTCVSLIQIFDHTLVRFFVEV